LLQIKAEEIGKKFKNEWIFKNLSLEMQTGVPIAIVGPNGSGKSTLMQSLSGIIPTNSGKVFYTENNQNLEEDKWHTKISYAAPYLELIEEFTLIEALKFHIKFKPFVNNLSIEEFLVKVELEKHKNKQIKNFSSGMKQKLKLGLVFMSQSDVFFLDEPSSNLDQNAFNWYFENVQLHLKDKLVIISSNEPREYSFCENHINILNYKS
jgi:ABC-type multidrug transport system ATPase subunit